MLVLAVVFALGWSAREWSQRSKARPLRAVVDLTERAPPMPPRLQQRAAPTMPSEPPAGAETRTVFVARCAGDGRVTYGDRACADGRTQTVEVERGPSGADPSLRLTPYQMEMLRSADARIARDAERARIDMQAMQRARAADTSECAAIRAGIESLDAAARQPMTGASQDAIRQQRMHLMSRAGQLRC